MLGRLGNTGNRWRQSCKFLSKSKCYLTPLTNCFPFQQHPCYNHKISIRHLALLNASQQLELGKELASCGQSNSLLVTSDSWIILNGGTRKQITHTSCVTLNQLLIDSWTSYWLVLCYEFVRMKERWTAKKKIIDCPKPLFFFKKKHNTTLIMVLASCHLMEITEFPHPASSMIYSPFLDQDLREDVFCRGSKNDNICFLSHITPFVTYRFSFLCPTKPEGSLGITSSWMPQNLSPCKSPSPLFHHLRSFCLVKSESFFVHLRPPNYW